MPVPSPADFVAQFEKGFADGDLEALVSLYDDDVVVVPEPGARLNGKDQLRAGLGAFLGMTPYTMTWTTSSVEGPASALVYGDWVFDGTSPEGPVKIEARATIALEKRADGWVATVDDFFSQA